jgi:hypothetical protein
MIHRPAVDLERTSLAQLRVGFAWCTCGRRLDLLRLNGGSGWRHLPTRAQNGWTGAAQ